MTENKMIVGHRQAVPADVPFVLDAWLESFRLSHSAGPIRMSRYRDVYREEIAAVLGRPATRAMVAFNSEDPEQLFGFVVHGREFFGVGPWKILHYVYVKNFCRRLGLATDLLRAAGLDPAEPFLYPYRTAIAGKLIQKWPGMRYEPMVVRFPPRDVK